MNYRINLNLIEEYLESKKLAWATTTLKSERPRLNHVLHLLNGNPETLWKGIFEQGAYSRVTTWVRVTDFWQWLIDRGEIKESANPYKAFREKYAKLFKHAYKRRKPVVSFEEARRRIETHLKGDVKLWALEILQTGMRFSESQNLVGVEVTGKGGKSREVFLPSEQEKPVNSIRYHTFRRNLGQVGLKPHDLRKLFLSRLVELGADEFDLCEVAGWSTIATATSYVKANNSKLRRLVEAVQRGGTSDVDEAKQVSTIFPRKQRTPN